ncbi:MAG: DNA ligase [Rubrivivax sp.]|nr:DNA ligase [Rubrivivax sp.]MDP3225278.1 DNA ligase [Rubrivivax sp.]
MASFTRRSALGSLLALCSPAWARQPFLPLVLAQDAPDDLDPTPYLVSEKYDGVRAYWDGQRLWFRSGLPLSAPSWFLAALPPVALDGELWLARGRFEVLVGAVRRQQAQDAEWRDIRFMAFELPLAPGSFEARVARIAQIVQAHGPGPCVAAPQERLPDRAALAARLQQVLAAGGEGLMLHRADAPFVAGRSAVLLKLKAHADAEAQVLEHLPGKGKHLGRLGALRVRTRQGVVLDIGTGFSDAERQAPPPRDTWITFTHRGYTAAGVPRFASFMRRREDT